jgi:ABC-type glycerol-3-phosphate transport system substrate-binding protein
MKTLVSVLIALSVLAGVATSASALDTTKTFWEQQDRQSH